MNLLLDTHVFLWVLSAPERIEPKVRQTIVNPHHQVFVSAVSGLEIEIKCFLGKLIAPKDLESEVVSRGLWLLPIHFKHTRRLRTLPQWHSDPFDRLLVCQAMDENLTLVTADAKILNYPVKVLRAA